MAVLASRLAADMHTRLLAAGCQEGGGAYGVSLSAFCSAVAASVLLELTAYGVVLPVALVAPPSGGAVTGTGALT